ncbi:hypothetical protein MRX96_042351 [Rhipicephalus microplus]
MAPLFVGFLIGGGGCRWISCCAWKQETLIIAVPVPCAVLEDVCVCAIAAAHFLHYRRRSPARARRLGPMPRARFIAALGSWDWPGKGHSTFSQPSDSRRRQLAPWCKTRRRHAR